MNVELIKDTGISASSLFLCESIAAYEMLVEKVYNTKYIEKSRGNTTRASIMDFFTLLNTSFYTSKYLSIALFFTKS